MTAFAGLFSLALPLVLLVLTTAALAASPANLPPRYRDWLQKEVPYIITKEEHDAFVQLPTDVDRDAFIERFWEIRNSTPGAPGNPFRDEHYRRIDYANAYLAEPGKDGWMTPRGRTYITIGPPKQKELHHNESVIRPVEVWFYQGEFAALPPYFYIVFADMDNTGNYKFYSPYMDGPEKLMTTLQTKNDRVQSLQAIDKSLGRELARELVTFLPDEPVDINDPTPSLASDVLVSTIKGLYNHPMTKDMLNRKRQILESVSHRVILGGEYLDVLTVPIRDTDGNMNLHYVLRQQKPEDFAVGQADQRIYFNIETMAQVTGPDGKPVYTQQKEISDYLSPEQFEAMKGKAFGYEGWLPLAPGKYKVEFLLSNKLKHTGYRSEREVVIPDPAGSDLRISDPVAFTRAEQVAEQNRYAPFTVAGVRFAPRVGADLDFAPGQDLMIFYQIWSKPGRKAPLQVEYSYGRPGAQGDAKSIRDEIAPDQFDGHGSMINGKRIPLVGASAGNYRLVITVTDPETQKKVYASQQFRVLPGGGTPGWDVYSRDFTAEVVNGTMDYQRGMSYLAQDNKDQAAASFKLALEKEPSNEPARARLADYYFGKQDFGRVAELYARAGVTPKTEEQTILRVAESLDKAGQSPRAIAWMENAITVRGSSQELYLTLAGLYQRSGNLAKAAELENKGKALGAQHN